jgi:hypothetical protein
MSYIVGLLRTVEMKNKGCHFEHLMHFYVRFQIALHEALLLSP